MMAYCAAGITIPSTSQQQWATGLPIPPGPQEPGDLVFFAGTDDTPRAPGHVGILISPTEMIDALHTGHLSASTQ